MPRVTGKLILTFPHDYTDVSGRASLLTIACPDLDNIPWLDALYGIITVAITDTRLVIMIKSDLAVVVGVDQD